MNILKSAFGKKHEKNEWSDIGANINLEKLQEARDLLMEQLALECQRALDKIKKLEEMAEEDEK